MAVIISGCQDEYGGIGELWGTIADGVFETGSSFGVKEFNFCFLGVLF